MDLEVFLAETVSAPSLRFRLLSSETLRPQPKKFVKFSGVLASLVQLVAHSTAFYYWTRR